MPTIPTAPLEECLKKVHLIEFDEKYLITDEEFLKTHPECRDVFDSDELWNYEENCPINFPYLYKSSPELIQLIKEFNPKWVVGAGEDTICSTYGYPIMTPKDPLYKMEKPKGERMCGFYPRLYEFSTKEGHVGLFLGQCERCANLSVIFLHEADKELAQLLSMERLRPNKEDFPKWMNRVSELMSIEFDNDLKKKYNI